MVFMILALHLFLVGRNDTAYIGYATVDQFDDLAITYFELTVMPRKLLMEQEEELLPIIGFHNLNKRGLNQVTLVFLFFCFCFFFCTRFGLHDW